MPNTLTIIFTSVPSTEPVEFQNPNSPGVYVTGTQQVNGTWQVIFTGVTKGTYGALIGRLKNYPAVSATIAANGAVLNNVLTTPTGTSASATSTSAISVTVSSIANQGGYRLFASDTSAGTYAQIYQGITASYPHTGLTAGQVKYYKWGYVGNGQFYDDSALSDVFSGVTVATAPSVVKVLVWVGDSRYTGSATDSVPLIVSGQFLSSALETGVVSTGGQAVGIVNALNAPIPSMIDELPTKVYPYIDNAKAQGKTIGVILEGGANDITLQILTGKTNQQCIDAIWASWQQYHSLVQARGAVSLHSTVFAEQSQGTILTDQQRVNQEAIRLALVVKMRNEYASLGIRIVSDVASDFELNNAAACANTAVYLDFVHLVTAAKTNIVVPIEKRAVQAFIDNVQGVVIQSLRVPNAPGVVDYVAYVPTGSTFRAELNWSYPPGSAGTGLPQFRVDGGPWQVAEGRFFNLAAGAHSFQMSMTQTPTVISVGLIANTADIANQTSTEETAASRRYSPSGWATAANVNWSAGNASYNTGPAGAGNDGSIWFEETFTGTCVEVWMPTGPNQGATDLMVDGAVRMTTSANGPDINVLRMVGAVSGLTNSSHVLRVVKRGGTSLYADRLTYRDGAATTPTPTPSGSGVYCLTDYVTADYVQ